MSRLYDTEPTELAPLGEFVDPDAVRAICENRRYRRQEGDIRVEFPYLDHLVTVKSYGIVDIEPLAADE